MGWKIASIFGLCLVAHSTAWFESCDRVINLEVGIPQQITSDGFPEYGYYPNSSCRYSINAPGEYQIKAVCNVNMVGSPESKPPCANERFYIGTQGNPDVNYAEYYCGNTVATDTSVYNEMTIAYISTKYSGQWNCTLTTFCDCGWGKSSRIVGGTVVGKTEVPPMAALRHPVTKRHYCGGSTISSYWIVTAAHCLSMYNIMDMEVGVGVWNLTSPGPYTAYYKVADYRIYPAYIKGKDYDDIALVKTATRIVFNVAVGPACLPLYYPQFQFANYPAMVLGYGTTGFGEPFPETLLKAYVNILPQANCSAAMSGTKTLADSQVCTFGGVGHDACQYDSGGPVLCRSKDTRLFHLGTISLGDGCGGDKPGINTRTTWYMKWIESVTGPLCRIPLAF